MNRSIEPYLSPIPGDEGFAVPNRCPDFHHPQLGAPTWWRHKAAFDYDPSESDAAIWFPHQNEPGHVVARLRRDNEGRRRNKADYEAGDSIVQIHSLGQLGLRPVLEAVGIHTRVWQSPFDSTVTVAEMVFPNGEQFCQLADAAADAGLSHIRFAPASDGQLFSADELVESLRKGRMLISAPDLQAADPEILNRDWFYFWHDMTYHPPIYLAFDARTVDHIINLAQHSHTTKQVKALTSSLDSRVHINKIPELAKRQLRPWRTFGGLNPGLASAASLTRQRLRQLRRSQKLTT